MQVQSLDDDARRVVAAAAFQKITSAEGTAVRSVVDELKCRRFKCRYA